MNKPFTLLKEDDPIQLQQIVELLKKKQAFLSEHNQMIQSLFYDPDNMDDEIVETEEYDDRISQNIAYVHRFVQRKTRHSSQESSFAAGSTTISRNMLNINLPKLDLPSFSGNYLEWISFFDRFKGAVTDIYQLTNSLRLQYQNSAVKGEASKMLTSITVPDDKFEVAMENLQNRYNNKRFILRVDIHGIVSYGPASNENTRKLQKLSTKWRSTDFLLRTWDNQLSIRTTFFLLDCRKIAHWNTKVLGAVFKGERTTDLSGTKDFPRVTCSSHGVSSTNQQFVKHRKTISFVTKSSTDTTSHSCHDNQSAMRMFWRGTTNFRMLEVQRFSCQGVSPVDQTQRTLFQLSTSRTPSRELQRFFMPPMWKKASHFVASRRYASN